MGCGSSAPAGSSGGLNVIDSAAAAPQHMAFKIVVSCGSEAAARGCASEV